MNYAIIEEQIKMDQFFAIKIIILWVFNLFINHMMYMTDI
jgi:hypothetical protein